MILTIGAVKGGVGKSLIATNMAVLRSSLGKKVLLVDADEQATTISWADQRTALGVPTPWTTVQLKSAAVRTEVRKMIAHYDDIIIDCGGRDTASLRAALTVSDMFLVPFQPKSFDIWTSEKVAGLVEEATALNEKLISYSVINCAGARGSDNDDARAILCKMPGVRLLPATIGLRKAFSNATAEGLGIIETKGDKKAVSEIMALHDILFKRSVGAKRAAPEKTINKNKKPVRHTRSASLT
jgi:chromosome partitioning protein